MIGFLDLPRGIPGKDVIHRVLVTLQDDTNQLFPIVEIGTAPHPYFLTSVGNTGRSSRPQSTAGAFDGWRASGAWIAQAVP